MKLRTIAAAALLSVAAPAVAFAQPAPAPAAPAAQPNDPGQGVGLSGTTDFNAFLQGFESADFTNATSGIDAATQFNVVKLSTLENADAAKLQEAMQPHAQDIASLSTQIGANEKAKAALDAADVDVADVVWVKKDPSGMWTIYVNDLGTSGAAGAAEGVAPPKSGGVPAADSAAPAKTY
jgi:hypothetical protein